MSEKPKILLIDFFNVVIAQNSLPAVNAIVDYNTYPIGVYLTVLNQIKIFTEKFKPKKLIIAVDGPDAGERRRQIFPEYKNKRLMKKRVAKVEIMDGEDNIVYGVEGAYQNQLIKIYEFLKLLPCTTLMCPYAEADDIIAYLALKNQEEFDIVIVSNDKDYLQLVNKNISVWRWSEKKLYQEKEIEQIFKILSKNFIFRKIALGDVGDNVAGLKGIGSETFKCLEPSLLSNEYNDIQEFLELLKTLNLEGFKTREKNAIKKALLMENEMNLAYSLMKLDENCIFPEQREVLKMQIEEQMGKKLSYMQAKVKMFKSQFGKLHKGFNDDIWLNTFKFILANVEIKY